MSRLAQDAQTALAALEIVQEQMEQVKKTLEPHVSENSLHEFDLYLVHVSYLCGMLKAISEGMLDFVDQVE